jgi:hypothetical protein
MVLDRWFPAALLVLSLMPLSFAAAQQPASSPAKAWAASNAENWDSLSLADSQLHAEPPVLGETADFPAFSRELLQVKWRMGDPIDLYVIKPKDVAKPPVVLYLYGYPTETDRFRDNNYCARVTKDGFAAIGFVSALTGPRYHDRPMKEWFVSQLQESLVSSVHDVQMILNYLSGRGDLDTSRVGMFGTGSGGTIAILAAAVDSRIQALDLLDPWGDWPEWLPKSDLVPEEERANFVKPEFLQNVAPFDPVQWLPKLTSQHIRLQHVMNDEDTPKAAKERMELALPQNAQMVRYDNVRQLFSLNAGGRLFQWVKDQLRPPPQPAVQNVQKSEPPLQGSPASHRN